jgi:aspartate-semialdehyde dehydrogenase
VHNLFPDKPRWWVARGVHRTGGLRGHSCSVSVYTPERCSPARAMELATEENPWMRVATVREVPHAAIAKAEG